MIAFVQACTGSTYMYKVLRQRNYEEFKFEFL